MDAIERTIRDVVIANRILARNNVLDAYGHVAIRHPERADRYFLARSVSPAIVEPEDVIEFHLDGTPVDKEERRPLYLERFIHGGVFEKRPDVMATLHSHADEILPFSISKTTRLRPVIHACGDMGENIPVWDIADKFGDDTTLLVTNMDHGRDLAACLDCNRMALMRAHGFVCVGRTINDLVRLSVYIPRNARTQFAAMQMGEYKALSRGEIEARLALDPEAPAMRRGWEFWAKEAGIGHLL
ncbi:MAG: class II aldolase/adducin family protein [Beijerinckiaceae bacterium]